MLLFVTGFVVLSAFAGGIGLIFFDGLGMSRESLAPYLSSFLIPGLILFFIVGGTNLAALILILKNWRYAMEAAMVAGFGLQIWIYTEMYIINESSWLQTLYFSLGTLILILAFILYGRLKFEK